jgi:hypothetical protein
MTLALVREAIDACASTDAAVFARRARNAIAQALLAESLGRVSAAAPPHDPPVEALRERVGAELSDALAAVYRGGDGWTTHAIDALEPLHELARRA